MVTLAALAHDLRFEIGELDVLHMAHLVDHTHDRWSQLLGPVRLFDHHRNVRLDPAQLLKEVDVEIGAAEFAVGDRLQADILLELDDLGDCLVLDLAQLGGAELALGLLVARLEQVLGAQETADMIGAERRSGALRHGESLAGKVGF
jgi:hypothetical protein